MATEGRCILMGKGRRGLMLKFARLLDVGTSSNVRRFGFGRRYSQVFAD